MFSSSLYRPSMVYQIPGNPQALFAECGCYVSLEGPPSARADSNHLSPAENTDLTRIAVSHHPSITAHFNSY